jgi:hypothetical protein
MRRISGPRRDRVKGGLRKLYNEGLDNLHCSPNKIKVAKSRMMKRARRMYGEKMDAYRT